MRSRAALLPFPGDPFLLHYWLSFFDRFWQDEVDHLYIHLNSSIEEPVVNYIRKLCAERPKVTLVYADHQIEHGDVIDVLLSVCKEDLVMLIEDDCYIFKSGVVNRCFEYLESGNYDLVGSKRGSCSMEILNRARQLWGLEYTGEGDQGCNFWPNMLFTAKERLLATDRKFGAKSWSRGEEIVPLSTAGETYYAQDLIVASDTFVNTSLQLQRLIPQERIKYIPQYHTSPDDLDHYSRGYNVFDGLAGYCHIGSLSSGVGGLLQDGHGRSLSRRLIEPNKGDNIPIPNYCNTDQEKWEFERRVQFWLTFWEERDIAEIEEFSDLYRYAIERIINEYQLSRDRIERRRRIYRSELGL